jgi:GTP 3',8-cyclase
MIRDHLGRTIRYLRLSLTAACHMRCTYCRPAFDRNSDRAMLTAAEIESLVRHLVSKHGLSKVRLTGGDPTARPDLVEIIQRLAAIQGLHHLAMTTNGLTLQHMADRYASAGLKRVNVSLDSLDREQFASITGVDGLERVLAGIDAALNARLTPLKINTVILRGENETQLAPLVDFAADRGVAIRFIELMPMGPLAAHWTGRYVSAEQMRKILRPMVAQWRPLPQGSDSAKRYSAVLRDGRETEVGFITPMSCSFCSACNRIRIASDGMLYPCLMDQPNGSILPALRPRLDPASLDRTLADSLSAKAAEHPQQGFVMMTHIGG